MKIHQQNVTSGYSIHAWEPGRITISAPGTGGRGTTPRLLELECSFILTPERLISDWQPQLLEQLQADHLTPLIELDPEMVLLGTGLTMSFPSPEVLAPLSRIGVGVEVMDSGAACRTYNLLAGDGRRVVAALLQG